jgi:hypothetical protein
MRVPSSPGTAIVALALSLSSRAAQAQVGPGEAQCAALRQLQVPGAALSEAKTEWFAAGSPPPQEPPAAVPLPVARALQGNRRRRGRRVVRVPPDSMTGHVLARPGAGTAPEPERRVNCP